jgi:hypothetical protein
MYLAEDGAMMCKSNRTMSLALSSIMLLATACTSGSAPDPSMTFNQVMFAMTMIPTQASTPLCQLKLKQWDRPMKADWYSCKVTPEVWSSLPISGLDQDDFLSFDGIAYEAELRRLHQASTELPALDPSSTAHRLSWREGDRLLGLAIINNTLVANLERDGRVMNMVYTVE